MSLHDRVAALPGGGRALAVARLRRAVLKALHRAFQASSLESQAELAKRLKVRRSAVNQVFRGDGNVRINTLAEYLYEMGFELDIRLVKSGELRSATVENREPVVTTGLTPTPAARCPNEYNHEEEPAFDENHYRYHTPAGPNPECANCRWLNWQQPAGGFAEQGGEEIVNHDTVREQTGEDA